MSFPQPHTIRPVQEHTSTIILLHGRGSSGPEFASELLGEGSGPDDLRPLLPGCKWVFPTAPLRWSREFQEDLRSWFDVASLTDPQLQPERQLPGLRESVEHIGEIVKEELRSVPAGRIVLGGISQGFAAALHALLGLFPEVAGFVGISGWIPFAKQISSSRAGRHGFFVETLGLRNSVAGSSVLKVPVQVHHCKDDNVVDFSLGQEAFGLLRGIGLDVSFCAYESGGHWLPEEKGYENLARFLLRCFGMEYEYTRSSALET